MLKQKSRVYGSNYINLTLKSEMLRKGKARIYEGNLCIRVSCEVLPMDSYHFEICNTFT